MKLFAAFQIATVVLAKDSDNIVDSDVCVYGGEEVDCETKEPLNPGLARSGKIEKDFLIFYFLNKIGEEK